MALPSDYLPFKYGNQAGDGEIQRTNNALLFIDGLSTIGAVKNSEPLVLAIKGFNVPAMSTAGLEVGWMGAKRRYAGAPSWEDVDITFHDYVDQPVLQTLIQWYYTIHDPRTERHGLARNYKKRGRIETYAPDFNAAGTRRYTLLGIFPLQVDPGAYDLEEEGKQMLKMRLSVDRTIAEFVPPIGTTVATSLANTLGSVGIF